MGLTVLNWHGPCVPHTQHTITTFEIARKDLSFSAWGARRRKKSISFNATQGRRYLNDKPVHSQAALFPFLISGDIIISIFSLPSRHRNPARRHCRLNILPNVSLSPARRATIVRRRN